ncbi:MAG: NineTeen Complex (NTC) component [Paramarteilia canceri]
MCDDLDKAVGFRKDVIQDIAVRVAGLGEHKIRDLNDEINNLLREKKFWDRRIVELGGPNVKYVVDIIANDGLEVPGNKGYKYFGAAKDLPGVRELFTKEHLHFLLFQTVFDLSIISAPPAPKKTKSELQRSVSLHYYGFYDKNEEKELEKLEIQQEIKNLTEDQSKHTLKDRDKIKDFVDKRHRDLENEPILKAVDIPDQKRVQQILLDMQKNRLIANVDQTFTESLP